MRELEKHLPALIKSAHSIRDARTNCYMRLRRYDSNRAVILARSAGEILPSRTSRPKSIILLNMTRSMVSRSVALPCRSRRSSKATPGQFVFGVASHPTHPHTALFIDLLSRIG
jgi:hypothetical protein